MSFGFKIFCFDPIPIRWRVIVTSRLATIAPATSLSSILPWQNGAKTKQISHQVLSHLAGRKAGRQASTHALALRQHLRTSISAVLQNTLSFIHLVPLDAAVLPTLP